MVVVVQDASTLINLLRSGLLAVAAEALELHILTTDLVAAEIRDPRLAFDTAIRDRHIEVRSLTGEALSALIEEHRKAAGLSVPDVSVVALARAERCPLFSSDGRVRGYAKQCEIIVHGELWILDRLVECGVLTPSAAREKLQEMLRHRARLPPMEVESRLARWNEKVAL
jgi:predicted nucleic acid-binding protein